MSTVPTTTDRPAALPSETQCAAVSTQLGAMTLPPQKAKSPQANSVLPEITDQDIENLFDT